MNRSIGPLPPALWSVLTAVTFVVAGCGADGDGPLATNRTGTSEKTSIEVFPQSTSIRSVGGAALLSALVKDAQGNPVNDAQVAWTSLDPGVATVNNQGLVTSRAAGSARVQATYQSVSATSLVTVTNEPLPPGGTSLTPAALLPVLGPIVARDPSITETNAFDNRYQSSEAQQYLGALDLVNLGAANFSNHYGALRGRIMWAIRNGEPYGAGQTDVSNNVYARGREIVLRYLAWSRPNFYMQQPHNNTGLADIEALYVLEGTPEALLHIACTAQTSTYDLYGYLRLVNAGSDPRQPAIALQAFNAAHRLGIPFRECGTKSGRPWDSSPGSWKAAGDRQIAWLLDGDPSYVNPGSGPRPSPPAIKADGSIPSPAHSNGWTYPNVPNREAFLFNAMIADELLRWYAYVEPDPRLLAAAIRVVGHMVEEFEKGGQACLPYLSGQQECAPDLAAFVVWPALVAWQETGDQRYRDFAVKHLIATRDAYVKGVKQWNQTFSTLAMGAEALMSGVPWR